MAGRNDYRSKKPKEQELPAPREVMLPTEWSEPAEWMCSERGRQAIALANKLSKTTAGLYASVPIICRGAQCKYAERCPLLPMNMAPYGEACAIEANKVRQLYEDYCSELNIDLDNFVDRSLIKELIDIDILMDRANNAIAVDGDFIKDVVVTVTPDGRPIKRPELHKAVDLKERLTKRRDTILSQLIATRKAKVEAKTAAYQDTTMMMSQVIAQALESGLIQNARQASSMVDASFRIIEDEEDKSNGTV